MTVAREELGPSSLKPSEVSDYRRNGYLHIRRLLGTEELAAVRHACMESERVEMKRLAGQERPDTEEGKRFAHQANDKYLRMFRSALDLRFTFPELRPVVKKLGECARQLLGTSDVRIIWDKTFVKPSRTEGTRETVWHQDLPYIPVDRRGLMTFWLPIHDVPVEAGAMRFLPGSHRLGPLGRIDLVGNEHCIEDLLTPEDLALVGAPVSVPIAAGDATVHDGLTLHGAHPNSTEQPRRVWACLFIPGDTLWNGSPLSHDNLAGYGLKPFQPFNHPDLMPG